MSENGLDSDIEFHGERFYEAPDKDTRYKEYTDLLRRAASNDRMDIVEEEYSILQDSDLPGDANLKHVYDKLMAVFEELLGSDYQPTPPEENDKPNDDPQMGLFREPS